MAGVAPMVARAAAADNRPGSSGLGMFIANEFALAIGAQIGVIRHRDGATFYVDVPASTQLRLL